MNYKYNIIDRLKEYNKTEYSKLLKDIPESLNKTVKTFRHYWRIGIDDFSDIPAKDLDIIAFHLNCSADDLKNYCVIDEQKNKDKNKKEE